MDYGRHKINGRKINHWKKEKRGSLSIVIQTNRIEPSELQIYFNTSCFFLRMVEKWSNLGVSRFLVSGTVNFSSTCRYLTIWFERRGVLLEMLAAYSFIHDVFRLFRMITFGVIMSCLITPIRELLTLIVKMLQIASIRMIDISINYFTRTW